MYLGDAEAEAEAAKRARDGGAALLERIEETWKHVRRDALAGISDRYRDQSIACAVASHSDAALTRRELDTITEYVLR